MLERDNRAAGPLRNLASHVPAEWWRTLFGALYLRTDGDVVENDRITAQEVDVLVAAAALSRRHRILDLCCGQGRHALELARRGFDHVTGLDHSSFLVQLARQRATASALSVTFREGDARESLPECGQFDRIYLMAIRSAISTILRTTAACSKQHGARSSRVGRLRLISWTEAGSAPT
jgi:D-alanine-D-alanine ligase